MYVQLHYLLARGDSVAAALLRLLIPYAFYLYSVGTCFSIRMPSIETGSIVCSLAPWLSRSHPTCEEQCIFFIFQKFKRAPMFVLESEKPLFEFEYATPHWDLLSALPPTFSSSTIYCLFTAYKPDTYRKKVSPARLYDFILSLKSRICDEA